MIAQAVEAEIATFLQQYQTLAWAHLIVRGVQKATIAS
jgi:hypothetical protein